MRALLINPPSPERLGLPLLGLILSGSRLSGESIKQPKRLVILSTTDVKGRTNPCG